MTLQTIGSGEKFFTIRIRACARALSAPRVNTYHAFSFIVRIGITHFSLPCPLLVEGDRRHSTSVNRRIPESKTCVLVCKGATIVCKISRSNASTFAFVRSSPLTSLIWTLSCRSKLFNMSKKFLRNSALTWQSSDSFSIVENTQFANVLLI